MTRGIFAGCSRADIRHSDTHPHNLTRVRHSLERSHVDALYGWYGAPRRSANARLPSAVDDMGRQR